MPKKTIQGEEEMTSSIKLRDILAPKAEQEANSKLTFYLTPNEASAMLSPAKERVWDEINSEIVKKGFEFERMQRTAERKLKERKVKINVRVDLVRE